MGTGSAIVVPAAHVLYDFNMTGQDKRFDLISSTGKGWLLEASVTLKGSYNRTLGSSITSEIVFNEGG